MKNNEISGNCSIGQNVFIGEGVKIGNNVKIKIMFRCIVVLFVRTMFF